MMMMISMRELLVLGVHPYHPIGCPIKKHNLNMHPSNYIALNDSEKLSNLTTT